jgi:hypothetical protein
MSTRLFPKWHGAEGYNVTGLAACCDWVVLSDRNRPFTSLRVHPEAPASPRTVFISMRNLDAAITVFARDILSQIHSPFILFTGSEDKTIPGQMDKRWPPHGEHVHAAFCDILSHPGLVTWWAENLDSICHPKIQPMPLGILPDDPLLHFAPIKSFPALNQRSLNVLCAHRVREGDQWEPRRQVTQLARQFWADWTTILDAPVAEIEFAKQLNQHSFVLCVEGGGLDPSPKAWHAMLHGAIPIIRASPTAQAYSSLPVIIVEEWNQGAITFDRLVTWRQGITDCWQSGDDWHVSWMNGLSLAGWWNKMVQPLGEGANALRMALPFKQ